MLSICEPISAQVFGSVAQVVEIEAQVSPLEIRLEFAILELGFDIFVILILVFYNWLLIWLAHQFLSLRSNLLASLPLFAIQLKVPVS